MTLEASFTIVYYFPFLEKKKLNKTQGLKPGKASTFFGGMEPN
jgi:hypothetical protein